jgi:hypothetical protein
MRNTFVTVFLIIIAFSLGIAVKSENKNNTPEIIENLPVVEEVKEEIFEYKSPFGFSFSYNKEIILENSSVVIPGGERVSAIAAVRYVKEQKCSESGLPQHCRAFLENPAIAFGVIEYSFEDLKTNQLKDVLQFSEPINLAGKEGIQYYAGVEGEGIITIALPFKENQTLLIQYTFDEMYDQIQKSAEVYGSQQQKAVIDTILASLKIN